MFPPFPTKLANEYCLSLIARLENGELQLTQIAKQSEERIGQGVMIGCLVCKDSLTGEYKILYAVSGNNKLLQEGKSHFAQNEIIVPSIVTAEQIEIALSTNDKKIHELTEKINSFEKSDDKNHNEKKEKLIQERTKLTDESLQKVFNLYTFTRFDGQKVALNQIILEHNGILPPTGTGDCSAPKLLSYAFEKKLIPLSMDEVYYGGKTKNKTSGMSYPPCDERCGYILPWILGLEILYRDEHIVVVNKHSGLLSVPGRGEEKFDSVETRFKILFPQCECKQPAVHRLDMETSGIMILALTKEAHKKMNMSFESRQVHKKYIALLDGVFLGEKEGCIELKFRLDVENRPHQIYDEEFGKLGITD